MTKPENSSIRRSKVGEQRSLERILSQTGGGCGAQVRSFRDSRAGYYEGYVGSFLQASAEVGVVPELAYAGSRATDILAGPHDLWDDIAIVRYASFSDLSRILMSPYYLRRAKPHQVAVLADWRFFVTRER